MKTLTPFQERAVANMQAKFAQYGKENIFVEFVPMGFHSANNSFVKRDSVGTYCVHQLPKGVILVNFECPNQKFKIVEQRFMGFCPDNEEYIFGFVDAVSFRDAIEQIKINAPTWYGFTPIEIEENIETETFNFKSSKRRHSNSYFQIEYCSQEEYLEHISQ